MTDVEPKQRLSDLRSASADRPLSREDLPDHPMKALSDWFDEALREHTAEPNALALATVDREGRPSNRTVLMKYLDEDGLVFFTNYESRKAREIEHSPHVAALFFWPELERQVRVRGTATRISSAESLRYFTRRPRESRIGAWVSNQSSVITSRSILESKWAEMKRRFAGDEIPLPSFWGGFRLRPREVEFWQGRAHRLHDRFLYRQDEGAPERLWQIERLAP